MFRRLPLLLLLTACPPEAEPGTETTPVCEPSAVQADAASIAAGAPQAGVAEAILELPIGTPLSGYTGRCNCFGGEGDVDRRDSNYAYEFAASAGVQTAPVLKAFWLSNGDQDFVIIKLALIYPFDGLVEEIEHRLSEATGRNLDGKVVLSVNHSHNSYGSFSNTVTYFLGSDFFNLEIFERFAEQATEVALTAHDSLQPAKIGIGFAKNWDPADRVYRDRRGDNDTRQFFDDIPAGSYKSPYLSLIRIDTMDDEPLGVLFDFGIHGTALDTDNAMISTDAPGALDIILEEEFDTPVVVAHLQGAGGDLSPAQSDGFYAGMESTGEHARDAIFSLWESVPTSADPIFLEGTGRSVPQTHADIHVTRGGTTDMFYTPYTEGLAPDNIVWDENGDLIPEIDEFNALNGAAFCGEDPPYLRGFAPADVFPYVNCVELEMMIGIIGGFFELPAEKTVLPLPEATKATAAALRIGPVPILTADGTSTTDDVLMGFFPGEPTTYFEEQFKRRSKAELGYDHSILVGYNQDEEGYLLIPEDWLQGGYEADINQWGPLQGEHIMEGVLKMADEVLATQEVAEDPDVCDLYQVPEYLEWEMPTLAPDTTPEAGTALTGVSAWLYSPLYSEDEQNAGTFPDLVIPAQVPRVQGLVQMAWMGGDPGVDWPHVTLEQQDSDGSWSSVRTRAGREVSGGPDILVTHTPDPIVPARNLQTHTWYAAWQAVGHVHDRAGLEPGTYRLHVRGKHYVGSNTTWPWDSADYELTSDPFEVVPGAVTVALDGTTVTASLVGPPRGYRLVGLDGYFRGNNPLPGDSATVTVTYGDGTEETVALVGSRSGGVTRFADAATRGDISAITVVDDYGNEGTYVAP